MAESGSRVSLWRKGAVQLFRWERPHDADGAYLIPLVDGDRYPAYATDPAGKWFSAPVDFVVKPGIRVDFVLDKSREEFERLKAALKP